MATKEAQINLRLPSELDRWVEEQAGGKRRKPAYIRRLLEQERARTEEAELQAMFDRAWDELTEEDREAVRAEREQWVGVYSGRKSS
jgi:hypothetical protein